MTLCQADQAVAVLTWADPEYIQRRTLPDGTLQPQSYVFVEGRSHRGTTRDGALERTTVADLARSLAQDLRRQQYYPATSVQEADLWLVLHWGTTMRPESEDEMRGLTGDEGRQAVANYQGAVDSGASFGDQAAARAALNSEVMRRETDAAGMYQGAHDNARLLGIDREIARAERQGSNSFYARNLRSLLSEDRYFIVVVAYDGRLIAQEKKLKRLWNARLSIRAPGVNFATAVGRMGSIGSQYFGRATPELEVRRAGRRETKVEIGEVIVVEGSNVPLDAAPP